MKKKQNKKDAQLVNFLRQYAPEVPPAGELQERRLMEALGRSPQNLRPPFYSSFFFKPGLPTAIVWQSLAAACLLSLSVGGSLSDFKTGSTYIEEGGGEQLEAQLDDSWNQLMSEDADDDGQTLVINELLTED